MIGLNGGLIGKKNLYKTAGSNPGVWTLKEQVLTKLGVIATGGTETFVPDGPFTYKVHTFLSSASLVVSNGGAVDYLVVAGGGQGGFNGGGGGGAGGFRT